MKRPLIGITMGDPAGCGPEITVKALRDPELYRRCRPLVVGDAKMIEDSIRILGAQELKVNRVSDPEEGAYRWGTIDVYHLDLVDMSRFEYGRVSAMCGEAAFQCVKTVIGLAMDGRIDATVTNALNKEAINLAGHHYSGHTEIYADLTKTDKYTMMLAHEDLRVVHVSTHVSLREACDRVKKDRVCDVIRIARDACLRLGIQSPRIGVAGLNPHAGENGLFGREEIEEIIPALEQVRAEGIAAEGPIPPDSLFSKARGGWYDIVVAMYHDQGHIPLKVLGFVYDKEKGKWGAVSGVNITLGLPIIRSSVDHGTAFGHAGQGVQNEISLVNAIDYAITLAENQGK
ncbi:4-hydroxythreonine-4-phosphate dehydrogenase PdxA [Bacilliculturomica massiliensis]|uniref:4-hydroxythreonine-4-phosphate dehydrogenase PdxA n=1 Tax=Bacilliculturomica massiliensis TaxID=1917867 RepID=UPI0010319926|nr:4-hydroxythreonine-4-phosphate dehydrogenase PdxA [Bacilliculturomica massiliensis]